MFKAFGIVNSSERNIHVEGLQDYRAIGAIFISRKISCHRLPNLKYDQQRN